MPLPLPFFKKYALPALLTVVLAAQTVFIIFLYFKLQDLQRNTELAAPTPALTYSPLAPAPRANTLKDVIGQGWQERSRSATSPAEKPLCSCPPGSPGPAGEKGEKGEKGDKGDSDSGDLTSGRWVTYCQSRLGPVRQKPSYGCDTGNVNTDYKESEFQLWVR